jgi:glucosamine kinase
MRVGEEEATGRLQSLLADASSATGPDHTNLRRHGRTLDRCGAPVGEDNAARSVAGEILLCGDVEIALDAAFRGGTGILVIAGTGSNVVGRAEDGRMHRAGGWGPAVGDKGSGHWIGG